MSKAFMRVHVEDFERSLNSVRTEMVYNAAVNLATKEDVSPSEINAMLDVIEREIAYIISGKRKWDTK